MAFENSVEAIHALAVMLMKMSKEMSEREQIALFEKLLTSYPEASTHGSVEFGLRLVGLLPDPQTGKRITLVDAFACELAREAAR